jgi:hypothetical protein
MSIVNKVKTHVAESIAIGLAAFVLVLIIANKLAAIPIGLFVGAAWSLYRGYKAHQSNSTTQLPNGQIINNTGNVPLWKTTQFIFAVALFVAGIVVLFMLHGDR